MRERFIYLDCLRNSEACIRWWKEHEVQCGRPGWGKRLSTLHKEWLNAWNGQFDQISLEELRERMRACESIGVEVYELFNDAGPNGEDVLERRMVQDLEVKSDVS